MSKDANNMLTTKVETFQKEKNTTLYQNCVEKRINKSKKILLLYRESSYHPMDEDVDNHIIDPVIGHQL